METFKMINIIDKTEASEIMADFGKPQLTVLQKKAFEKLGYLGGAREFIIGNTSSGKTAIPIVAFKKAKEEDFDSKLLYIVPSCYAAACQLILFMIHFL